MFACIRPQPTTKRNPHELFGGVVLPRRIAPCGAAREEPAAEECAFERVVAVVAAVVEIFEVVIKDDGGQGFGRVKRICFARCKVLGGGGCC